MIKVIILDEADSVLEDFKVEPKYTDQLTQLNARELARELHKLITYYTTYKMEETP